MKILIADKFEQSGIEGLKSLGAEVVYEPAAGAEGLGAALSKHGPDILVVRSSKVTPPVIQESRGLKGIIRAGAGVDNIDVPTATGKGVAVCNCPGTNSVAVAELTMGLLLSLDRRLVDQTNEVRSGKWNKKEYAKSRGLKGGTLAVVGMGAIGRAVIQRARAFEMNVIAWSRSLTEDEAGKLGVRFGGNDRASLLKVLPQADAVSVHIALTPETKKFCNGEFFAAMKQGAYFINTSRGGTVDEAALRDAARNRGIRVGLDVYENQPGTPQAEFSCETVNLPAGTFTHHCGASTDQAQQAVADEVVRIVKVFQQSGKLENRVN
jgi:D-3-phosphoglycerate dehydrogenase / 2-oxoglutarate reductase